ncbi:MAG: hypothetical protein MJ161_05935 [Clostridia bacterium]|nr:hypothetical protein [Clostridia bacterium]
MSDKFTLVRAPSGYEKSKFAFFPGCCLCAQEPEIAAKVYDSMLFQNQDTAIFMQCCDNIDEIREAWIALGKPQMIMCCSECEEVFADKLPEIPVVSLYDKFIEYEISGGCNSVDYCLHESVKSEAVVRLAEDMGVTIHEYEENSTFPYLVSDINIRNRLKESGHDAAHILELMFGMGASNTHLIHEHDHGDEAADNAKADETFCDGNCSACAGCQDKPHPPQPLPTDDQKEANRLELKEVLLALYWGEI